MNEINVTESKTCYGAGSFWSDENTDDIYILASLGPGSFVAICLSNGEHWDGLHATPTVATNGLMFLCHSATITIEPKE